MTAFSSQIAFSVSCYSELGFDDPLKKKSLVLCFLGRMTFWHNLIASVPESFSEMLSLSERVTEYLGEHLLKKKRKST